MAGHTGCDGGKRGSVSFVIRVGARMIHHDPEALGGVMGCVRRGIGLRCCIPLLFTAISGHAGPLGHASVGRHLLTMTDIAMTDAAVIRSTIERAAAGDESACVRLVDEHHAPMLRTAYVIAGDADLAREATQIAWTKAWRRIGSLRNPDHLRSWLVAIAANEARQLMRARGRRVFHEVRSAMDVNVVDPTDGIEVLDLRRAVSRLSLEDQSLLALRFVAGLDSSRIGQQTGMSASGVRSRLARLLDRLREELDDA